MFKCYVTGKNISGEKPEKVVIETRQVQYMSVLELGKVAAVGHEIVREVLMSKAGYQQWKEKNER